MLYIATGKTCAHPSILEKPRDGKCSASSHIFPAGLGISLEYKS